MKRSKKYVKNKNYQFWFCTGSQDLYGDECLAHVAEHSKIIVDALINQETFHMKSYGNQP